MWEGCLSVITFSDWGKMHFRDLYEKLHLISFLVSALHFVVWLLCRDLHSHFLTEDQVEESQRLENLAIRHNTCLVSREVQGSFVTTFFWCSSLLLLFVHMSMLFPCHTSFYPISPSISHVSTGHNFIIKSVECSNIWCYPFLVFRTNKYLRALLGNMLIVLAEKDRTLKIMYLEHDYYFSGHLTSNTVLAIIIHSFHLHITQLERAKHRFNALGIVH